MEEFMLLVKGYDYANVSPEIMEKRMNAYRPWMEKMTQAGRYKGGQPLEPGSGRLVKDKKTVLTDGPSCARRAEHRGRSPWACSEKIL